MRHLCPVLLLHEDVPEVLDGEQVLLGVVAALPRLLRGVLLVVVLQHPLDTLLDSLPHKESGQKKCRL